MVSRWLALLLVAPLVYALDDSSPVVAWSSSSSSVLSSVSSQKPLVAPSEDVLGSILVEELCNYDAVIVVEQPGVRSTHFRLGSPSTSDTYTPFYQQLHASDLRTLLPTSYIARQLQSASSSVHVPYVTHASPAGAGRKLATLCRDAKVVEMELDQDAETLQLPVEGKKLIHIDLPELHSVGPERREEMRHLDEKLALLLTKIQESFPSHFILLTGTTASSFNTLKRHVARSQAALPDAFKSPRASEAVSSNSKPRGKKTGIFHRYQLLTPGLITTLGITFLLVTPFILLVINALAGIKSPIQSQGLKQAHDKKSQ